MKATLLRKGRKVVAIGLLNPDLKPITPSGVGKRGMRISLKLAGGKGVRAAEVEIGNLKLHDPKAFSKKMGELRATLMKTKTPRR